MRITCAASWPIVVDAVEAALQELLPDNTVGRVIRRGQGCLEVGLSS